MVIGWWYPVSYKWKNISTLYQFLQCHSDYEKCASFCFCQPLKNKLWWWSNEVQWGSQGNEKYSVQLTLCEDRVTLKFIHKAAYKLKINRFFFVSNWTVTFYSIPFIYTHHYYFPKDFCLRFKHLFDIKCPTGNFGGWLEIISPVGYIYLFLYLLFFCPGRFLLMCLPSINLLDFHLFELVAVVS